MSKLNFGSITVIVNGFTLNNGLPYFQRAVPAALRSRLGKATIKIRLHEHNGNFAIQCHRLTNQYTALFRAMKNDESIVPSEEKLAAVAMLDTLGLTAGDGLTEVRVPLDDGRIDVMTPAHDIFIDFLMEREIKPSAVTKAAISLLDNKLPVLLSEAFTVYLDNHSKGQDKKFQEAQKQHWNKLVNLVGDKPIKALSRPDARMYRDHRLASGVAPTTVAREINAIKAILAKAIRELSLGIPNQFSAIEVPHSNKNAHDRLPYSPEEIGLLLSEALKVNDEQRRLVITLALTGTRLAEIVGLRRQDLDLAKQCIYIKPHKGRSLKNENSTRDVPLLSLAFNALKEQAEAVPGDFLFPTYANKNQTNSNSASATLNKWAKKFVPDKSMHCFRHSLRDLLRAVRCPEAVSKEIGGWTNSQDVSEQYGFGHPLEIKLEWLEKAYSGIHCVNKD